MSAPLHRCLAVAVTTTAAAAALDGWLVPIALTPASGFDGALVRLFATVAVIATAWLGLCGLAVAFEAAGTARRQAPGIPAPVRRAVLVACGVAAVASLATPAGAATPHHEPPQTAARVVASALAGLPLPDRPHGSDHRPPPVQTAETVTVRPGDTLWSLAADHLGDGDRWPELYAANRAVVGADPDLIRPAQRLRLPVHPKETR